MLLVLLIIIHAVVNVVFSLDAIEPIDEPNIEIAATYVGQLVFVGSKHGITARILWPRPLHHIC